MAHELHEAKRRLVTVAYTKSDGTAGAVEGVPVWESSEPTIMSVTALPDGMSAHVAWLGVGVASVKVTADADLGTDVFPIVVSHEFTMIAPLGATAGTVTVGDEIV